MDVRKKFLGRIYKKNEDTLKFLWWDSPFDVETDRRTWSFRFAFRSWFSLAPENLTLLV